MNSYIMKIIKLIRFSLSWFLHYSVGPRVWNDFMVSSCPHFDADTKFPEVVGERHHKKWLRCKKCPLGKLCQVVRVVYLQHKGEKHYYTEKHKNAAQCAQKQNNFVDVHWKIVPRQTHLSTGINERPEKVSGTPGVVDDAVARNGVTGDDDFPEHKHTPSVQGDVVDDNGTVEES